MTAEEACHFVRTWPAPVGLAAEPNRFSYTWGCRCGHEGDGIVYITEAAAMTAARDHIIADQ